MCSQHLSHGASKHTAPEQHRTTGAGDRARPPRPPEEAVVLSLDVQPAGRQPQHPHLGPLPALLLAAGVLLHCERGAGGAGSRKQGAVRGRRQGGCCYQVDGSRSKSHTGGRKARRGGRWGARSREGAEQGVSLGSPVRCAPCWRAKIRSRGPHRWRPHSSSGAAAGAAASACTASGSRGAREGARAGLLASDTTAITRRRLTTASSPSNCAGGGGLCGGSGLGREGRAAQGSPRICLQAPHPNLPQAEQAEQANHPAHASQAPG